MVNNSVSAFDPLRTPLMTAFEFALCAHCSTNTITSHAGGEVRPRLSHQPQRYDFHESVSMVPRLPGMNMKAFDYISVLLSFVISLVFAQVLTGISHMIQSGVRRISIPSLYWIGFVLYLCVDFWFSIWGLRDQGGWSFLYVCWLLLFASLLFLVARSTVPEASSEETIDLTALYERNRRKIMVLFMLFSLVGVVVNVTLPGYATSELLGIALVMMALYGIAWRWKSQTVQFAVIAVHAPLLVYYTIRYEPLLS